MDKDQLRRIHDEMRTTMIATPKRRIMLSSMVSASVHREQVIEAIRLFNEADFSEDNDPYGEHDFGCVVVEGERYYFKIDRYNSDLTEYGHDVFVMTIMHASEY